MAGKRIGEILIEKGLIRPEQLEDALKEQKGTNQFLGSILVHRGLISEEDLATALAEQFGLAFVRLKDVSSGIDFNLARKCSSSLISKRRCFPLYADIDSVTVAIIDPLEAEIMSAAEREVAPLKARFVLMTPQDLCELLDSYHRSVSNNIKELLEKRKEKRKHNE
jgi:type IV pilus assembly protein PilB